MTTRVGMCVALLVTLFGGWVWGASGRWDLGRALRAAEMRDDLLEARASVLGARVNLCNADFGEMRRQLENARGVVGRARARRHTLSSSEPQPLDLAAIGIEIDEAQRLATRLSAGSHR